MNGGNPAPPRTPKILEFRSYCIHIYIYICICRCICIWCASFPAAAVVHDLAASKCTAATFTHCNGSVASKNLDPLQENEDEIRSSISGHGDLAASQR